MNDEKEPDKSPNRDIGKRPEEAATTTGPLGIDKTPEVKRETELSPEEQAFYETCPTSWQHFPKDQEATKIIESLEAKGFIKIIKIEMTGSLYYRKSPK